MGQRGDWRFSDAGTKFDGRPKPTRRSTQKPISPALKRGVIHCARCGSRVVSNLEHCPFCGSSLRPIYARFWFWILVVIFVTVGVVWIVNSNLPQESSGPASPVAPDLPQVIGGSEDSSLKELTLGTAIDNSDLEVVVNSVVTGPKTANGSQIYSVEIVFINTTSETITLFSTQWMLELSDATRVDTFVGTALDGTTISSNFEALSLEANGRFVGRLYFAVAPPEAAEGEEVPAEGTLLTPTLVVYQPSALAYREELLVTWKVAVTSTDPQEPVENLS